MSIGQFHFDQPTILNICIPERNFIRWDGAEWLSFCLIITFPLTFLMGNVFLHDFRIAADIDGASQITR